MNAPRLLLLTSLAAALSPAPAIAGDFMDTRLVFIAGDDDFMHSAGVTVPPSQRPDIGDRAGYDELYDEREVSESGRESRSHLVLHKRAPGFAPGLLTEAALVLQLDHARLTSGDPRALRDDGTYLQIEQTLGGGTLGVLLMPFSSDRVRLGYLWDITWAGDRIFPGADGVVPALRTRLDFDWWGLEVGAKTARMQFVTRDLDERNGQIEAFYGLFGGARLGQRERGPRLDLSGGFFEKGRNPNGPVRGERVDAGGASARLSFVSGLPFQLTTDTRLYSADPLAPWNVHVEGGRALAWRVAAEATYVGQVLEDADEAGGTTIESGLAGALHGRARLGRSTLRALALFRDLGFLFFNAPGVNTRFQALPRDADVSPEWVLTMGADHHLPEQHLTVGVTGGVQLPASYTNNVPRAGLNAPALLQGEQVAVYRRANMFDDTGLMVGYFLPGGERATPVAGARIHVQLDLADGFGLLADVTGLYDGNRVFLEQDPLHVNSVRALDDPFTVGASVMARAEW